MHPRTTPLRLWKLMPPLVVAGCLPLAIIACGGGGGGTTQNGPTVIAPAITAQPANLTVTASQPASFSVTATGTAPLTYQWKKDGTALTGAGATAATYQISQAAASDAGSYTVTVTNAAGFVTSNAAVLTVNPAVAGPAITAQPANLTVTAGQPASFSVTATGTAPLTYQWKKDGTALTGTGATSATYQISQAAASDAGSYTVTVTNAAGFVTSNAAVLTVNPAVAAPVITTQPQVQNVMVGDPATFSVTATGENLSYQWKRGGNAIQGATAATYTLPSTVLSDEGATFTVQVSNAGGSATSDGALLHVWPAGSLSVTKQPVSQTSLAPDGATFSVSAVGTNLKYQWQKNGSAIPGATLATYTTGATDLHELSAHYNVVVSSGASSVTSENATHTVMAPEPTYAGDPVAYPSRPLTTLPSYNVGTAFPHGAFRFGYDEALKDPAWTAYADFKFITAYDNPDRNFQADDRLAAPLVTDSDYSGSGWTRGHQAMMSDVAYRYGSQAGLDTCRMSNICPQSTTHNTYFWENFEQIVGGGYKSSAWVPGLADKFNRIWVYTGPVFDATPARMNGKIAIPSGFWKVIVRESAGQPKALAILSPHAYTPPNEDLWKYVTSVARIEEMAGLNLFPSPTNPLPATFKTEVDVRGWGTPFEQTTKPNVHMVNPSWDESVAMGTPVTFTGAATSVNSTVASTAWTFGDGGTATTPSATHTFTAGGTYNVTYTATDALGASNSITRVITVTGGNTAPTVTGLPTTASTAVDTPKDLPFTVSDDVTPLSVTFSASSSNTAVVPNSGLTFPGTSASQILHIVPAAGATGTTTLTILVTDGNGATTTKTVIFAVGTTPPAAGLTENFTWAGTGTTYATGDFTLSTGSWHFVTTLSINSDTSDAKNDGQSLRMKKDAAGSAVWMNFDYGSAGNTVSKVTVAYGVYKSDATAGKTASFSLYASADAGTTWTKVGDSVTASSNTLTTATFGGLTLAAPVRFKLAVDGTPAARLNLDDFVIQ